MKFKSLCKGGLATSLAIAMLVNPIAIYAAPTITDNIAQQTPVIDNLTSDNSSLALSAKQGKVLDGKITSLNDKVVTIDGQVTDVKGKVLVNEKDIDRLMRMTAKLSYHRHTGETGACYTPIYHQHTAQTGSCYKPNYHQHSGSASGGGGCYGGRNYHQHSGSASGGGGCYGNPIGHTHTGDALAGTGCWGGARKAPGYYAQYKYNPTTCSYCGAVKYASGTYSAYVQVADPASPSNPSVLAYAPPSLNYQGICTTCFNDIHGTMTRVSQPQTCAPRTLNCGKTGNTKEYSLVCGKSTSTIDSYYVNCGKTAGSTVDSYYVSCGKTAGSTVDSYSLTCPKTPGRTVDSYKFTCTKSEDAVENVELIIPDN